jgi:iron complex outermembrane recepter protein
MQIRNSRRNRLAMAISATLAGLGAGSISHAQAQGQSPQLEEIIVTARKTEESLQDVPISITAFTAQAIEEAGIESVVDLASQTPGFSFNQGFGRSGGGSADASSRPSIRGMSSILGTANASFFVDGIFVSGNPTSYQLDNLERVEVIRGPQSALFGRQTFGGAINFVTRKPTDETRGQVNVTAGEHDHYEASGFISGAIVPGKFTGELSARHYSFGGDYRNESNGKKDINGQQTENVGVKLRFTPTDKLDILLMGAYSKDEDDGYASTRLLRGDLDCFMPNITGFTSLFPGGPPIVPVASNRTRGWICGEIKAPDSVSYDIEGLAEFGAKAVERESKRSALTIDWSMPGDWQMTSITAYNTTWNINGYDNTLGVGSPVALTVAYSERDDWSQELRFLSPRDRKLRGLFGFYYYDVQDKPGYNVFTQNPTPAQVAAGVVRGQRSYFDTNDQVENKAVFAMVEYDFTDRLTMSLEGRYQEDKITDSAEVDGTSTALTPPRLTLSETYKEFLPRLTARYALSEEINLYGSIARGNKPGGFNFPAANANAASIAEFESAGLTTFDEEQVDSFELGVKGTFADRRYSYNVAAYYLDWTKQQLTQSRSYQTTTGAFSTVPYLVNAGETTIQGIEVELVGRPVPWFDFRIAYAWADAEFDDYYDINLEELLDTDGRNSFLDSDFTIPNPDDVDGPNGQAAGKKIPQTGEHQAAVNTTFRVDFAGDWTAFLRNDFTYESKRYTQTDNFQWAPEQFRWNLRAGVERKNITATFYVNNLTDEGDPLVVTRLLDFSSFLNVPDQTLPSGRRTTFYRGFLVSLPRLREMGLQVNYRF